MLRKHVLPQGEKPIWFEIYALHPPYNEPRYDQKSAGHGIKEILYEEDLIRSYVQFVALFFIARPLIIKCVTFTGNYMNE